jgi:3-deoxy-7-phosphoheptulonate synthase
VSSMPPMRASASAATATAMPSTPGQRPVGAHSRSDTAADELVARTRNQLDRSGMQQATAVLRNAPTVVMAEEVHHLRDRLAEVARGEGFLLQGRDGAQPCAGDAERRVRGTVEALLRMGMVLAYSARVPVVHLGHVALQHSTSRLHSSATGPPAHHAEKINSPPVDDAGSSSAPARMIRTYADACSSMNLLRAVVGSTDMRLLHERTRSILTSFGEGERHTRWMSGIDRSLTFMAAYGVPDGLLQRPRVFAGHDVTSPDLEGAMLRTDTHGRLYSGSGHFLWVDRRGGGVDGAPPAFGETLANPIGVDLGPTTTPGQAARYAQRLDPDRQPGKLTLVSRMGGEHVRDVLPDIIGEVHASGHEVIWQCDPVHTRAPTSCTSPARAFDRVVAAVEGFFEIHRALGTHPGGIRLDLGGEHVGGGSEGGPSLSGRRALELSFLIAELLG